MHVVSGTGLYHTVMHHETYDTAVDLLADFVLWKIILKLLMFLATCNNTMIG